MGALKFSSEFIERVRESTNIVDIISSQTQLKRSGPNRLMGLCPFHMEKTPSFSVSEDKQMYHCFGCKRAGNVFTFIQETQGLSFPETVEYLAQKAGIPIPKESRLNQSQEADQDQKKVQEKLKFRINQFAAQYFQVQLRSAPIKVAEYLKARRIEPETIEKFQLGYASGEWESLVGTMQRKGIPLAEAESLGLIRSRGAGKSGHFDMFRDRLMFPIFSPTGQVLGFGGRILGEGQPKYLNSPESEVFHKGRVFYGLHESAKHIRLDDQVIVVEGYMDFLALYQAGFKSVVATLGTALTAEHARLLKRFTKNVIVLFDGDSAGQEAAERSLPILLSEGLTPRGLILPSELDPDEFIQENGPEALREALKSAPELFVMVFERHLKGYRESAAEKVALIDKLSPWLKSARDERLRDLYVSEVAERLRVEPDWVYRALEGARTRHEPPKGTSVSSSLVEGGKKVAVAAKAELIDLKGAPRSELYLLNVALMKDKYYQQVKASGVTAQLSHPGVRRAFERFAQLYLQLPNKFDSLSSLLVVEVAPAEAVGLHLQPPLVDLTVEGAVKLISDCIRKIQEVHLRTESKKLRSSLKGQDPESQREKLEQIMNIHRSRHFLTKDS